MPNEELRFTYVLEGDIPSKKNSKNIYVRKTKAGKHRPFITSSDRFKEWREDAYIQMMAQFKPIEPLELVSTVVITIYYSTLRATDLTNTAEGIMDLLVESNVLADDNYKVAPAIFLYGVYRKGKGGAKIIVQT